jgi:hypothetical protein
MPDTSGQTPRNWKSKLLNKLTIPGWIFAFWAWFWKIVGWLGNLDVVRDHWPWVVRLATKIGDSAVSYFLFATGIIWLVTVDFYGDRLTQRFKPWKVILATTGSMIALSALAAWIIETHHHTLTSGTEGPAPEVSPIDSSPQKSFDEPRTAREHEAQTQKTAKAKDQAESRLSEADKMNLRTIPQQSSAGGATAVGTVTLTVRGPQLGLREQAFIDSASILNFLLERERGAPPYPSPDLSASDWSKVEAEIRTYNAETIRQFNQAWGPSVVRLHDSLAAKGLQDPALDDLYNRPTNPLGIRVIGEKIGDLAERLPPDSPAQ